MDIESLVKSVIDGCWEVHRAFEPGYLESVYKNALIHELRLRGMDVKFEAQISVDYKGIEVGSFRADLIINNSLIIEIKAVSQLTVSHEIQLVNYLKCTGIDNGLLVNFGSDRLELKRKYRQRTPV